jgi:nuclear pore complex protein Nup53
MVNSQRMDEVPVVQTKAKMNLVLSRGAASDFGMDSMFENPRQRQNLADEDAPPTNSINDIPNETYSEANSSRFHPPRSSALKNSQYLRRQSLGVSNSQPPQTLYIIVFGYPPDKYSVTVEYFKSLGESTEAEQNTEITNCFRIGYKDAGDAMRAVRKNGEVFGGSWMVGAKWADAAQAEALVGNAGMRSSISTNQLPDPVSPSSMSVDELPSPIRTHTSTPTLGTPIKLAPSASAFRRPGPGEKAGAQRQTTTNASTPALGTALPPSQLPNKGVLGQVSDMIFGW